MAYIYNLGQKFKQIASQTPNAVALRGQQGSMTYSELDQKSDQFCSYLSDNGLSAGDVVCIAGEKQFETIAAIIGSLKNGCIYSVFDPDSPAQRLFKIFNQCRPKLLVCAPELQSQLQQAADAVIDFETIAAMSGGGLVVSELPAIPSSSPAYIMFTSGSTGVPKGAVMTHQNVLNLIEWAKSCYGIQQDDVFTNVNPLYFDNSVFDLYSSLFSGASLVLFSKETVRNPGKLLQEIDEHGCTSWFSVPSMLMFLQSMRALTPDSFKSIRRIIFGGEGYPKAKLKQLFDLFSDRIRLYNVYGPTECTCICSSYAVAADDFADLKGFLPLGELAPNFTGLVVDEEFRSVVSGEVGELVLQGPNVGLGYYADPARTQAAFIQNPTHSDFRDIVYRTGDLVFINPSDRKINIVGRSDNQVKHMGYRIELEEIENALSCIPGVQQCAVIHCELKGLSHLVAFVSAKTEMEEDAVRKQLQKLIPQYMIPTRFHFMQKLPKNANGKLDRKTLKAEFVEQKVNG